jgi:hypothetical protein
MRRLAGPAVCPAASARCACPVGRWRIPRCRVTTLINVMLDSGKMEVVRQMRLGRSATL